MTRASSSCARLPNRFHRPSLSGNALVNDASALSYQAGIISDVTSRGLVIALEPEAASLHCRRLDVHDFVGEDEYREANFQTGTKYLVIDAGGQCSVLE